MNYLLSLHSILRWLILLFALVVIIQSLKGMVSKGKFGSANKRFALFLLICCDLQLLFGLALYYTKGWFNVLQTGTAMASKTNRFFSVEHSIAMLIAIILVHTGYSAAKSNIDDDRKFKRLFWYVLIALVLIIAMVPWPWSQVTRPLLPNMQ